MWHQGTKLLMGLYGEMTSILNEKTVGIKGSPRTRTTTKYRSEQCKRAATDIPSVAALLYYKS